MPSDLTKNYFELFGLQAAFDIDLSDLEFRFRKLQKEFHPDRFASVSDQERRIAVQLAAQINEAYQTLSDPLGRGIYLLRLNGVNLDNETDTRMDAAFLMEQMELREQLNDASSSKDPERKIGELNEIILSGKEKRTEELQKCFNDISNPENRKRARELVREMQFLDKISRQIDELADELI